MAKEGGYVTVAAEEMEKLRRRNRELERSRGDEDGDVGVVAADGSGRRGGGESLLAAGRARGRVS
ncbi:hypothetical protein Bca52824_000695 [Brassica carinata]|uniref:Uncharacterized protein n=1 Tax=Brassica carinata TaxID=52824 RepID=A0A8X8BBX9_BRACI|nr:hypothetical protein Bca52824_000695 [Brassica carinata]